MAVSHVADVVTVKLRALPPLVTVTICAAGAVPPDGAVKVKLVGLTVNPPLSSARTESSERNNGKASNARDRRTSAIRRGLFGCFHMSSSLGT